MVTENVLENELEIQEAFHLYRKENIKVLGPLAIVI
jgi:cytochrome bd-type quinol oxidase subunit 2